MRVRGHPNLVIIFLYINLVATSLEHASNGLELAHLVTYSIAVIIYLALIRRPRIGNNLTNSIV